MGRLERVLLAAVTSVLAASVSSCFAVTDLNRFDKGSDQRANFNHLSLTVRGMTSHVNELFEYRIVDVNNTLQSRGQIVPLGDDHATLFVPGAVPNQNGPFNLDFYADHDLSGTYGRDALQQTGDHSWRIPLKDDMLDDTGTFVIVFDHNTSFSILTNPAPPRETGTPANIKLANMAGFIGKRVQMRVADASSKRVVALYRIPSLKQASQDVSIPGMIEGGVTYSVEVYTDDGATPPGAVRAFRVEKRSSESSLDVDFDPAGAPEVNDAARP